MREVIASVYDHLSVRVAALRAKKVKMSRSILLSWTICFTTDATLLEIRVLKEFFLKG